MRRNGRRLFRFLPAALAGLFRRRKRGRELGRFLPAALAGLFRRRKRGREPGRFLPTALTGLFRRRRRGRELGRFPPAALAGLFRRRKRRLALGRFLPAALAGLFVFFGGSAFLMQRYLDAPLELSEEGADYLLRPGASMSAIFDELVEREILRNPLPLKIWARFSGLERKMIAGEYHLQSGASRRGLLEQLSSGRVREHELTLIEGWTFARMLDYLHSLPVLKKDLLKVGEAEILQRLGAQGHASAEGLFFPDTYTFRRGVSDLDILRIAQRRMNRILEEEWRGREAGLPLRSPYQALVLASIIEKETAVSGERSRIAGVFIRRLRRGMRLEADPTVRYGLGKDFDGPLTQSHLRDRGNPYNSYRRRGLPPTPIALPGRASIHAALNPEDGDSLYFVARGDGSHVFSASLEEHHRAVADYRSLQRKRRSEDAGRP